MIFSFYHIIILLPRSQLASKYSKKNRDYLIYNVCISVCITKKIKTSHPHSHSLRNYFHNLFFHFRYVFGISWGCELAGRSSSRSLNLIVRKVMLRIYCLVQRVIGDRGSRLVRVVWVRVMIGVGGRG